MTISSRTPEGAPHRCPVCGKESSLEPSYPSGDSCCSSCGQLLWWFRDRLGLRTDSAIEQLNLATEFDTAKIDSLQVVELVMQIEERFNLTIPDEVAERLKTIADVIRYIRQRIDTDEQS